MDGEAQSVGSDEDEVSFEPSEAESSTPATSQDQVGAQESLGSFPEIIAGPPLTRELFVGTSEGSVDEKIASLELEKEGLEEQVTVLKGRVAEFESAIASERATAKDLESKWLRAVADFENYQRRIKRDLERDRQAFFRRILGELVAVVDNVALLSENAARPETTAESIVQAVDVGIKAELMAIMGRNGVAPMGVKPGDAFDPSRHEAVSVVDEEGSEKQDLVLSVLREGYTIGQSILRTATVVVKRVRLPKPQDPEVIEPQSPSVGG